MDLTIEAVAGIRAQLWDSGFRPVPICNWDNSWVEPGSRGKRPLDSGWHNQALLNPPRASVTLPTLDQLNTGVLCDGLRAFDLDIDDAEVAAQVRALIFTMLGVAPARYRENSGRSLILYRASVGEPDKLVLAGTLGKVEVLGHGQQFVAFGRHQSGFDLYWHPDPPGIETLDELPVVTEEQVAEVLAAIAPLLGATVAPRLRLGGPQQGQRVNGEDHGEWDRPTGQPIGKGEDQLRADDPLLLIAALQAIPNDARAPANWEAWNGVGMALWAATGGSALGRDAWHAWSGRHPSYDPVRCDERWKHYPHSPPTQKGAGSIYHDAAEHGWKRPVVPLLRGPAGEGGEPLRPDERVEFPATPVNLARVRAVPRRQWVYGHLLIRRFVSVLGAPGGTGKTAYAYAVALAVVTGRALVEEKVHQIGPVWIYNLEDPQEELDRRLLAALIHHGITDQEIEGKLFLDSGRDRELVIATATKDAIIRAPIVDAMIAEIKRRKLALMIVDPFIRSHRLNENDNAQIDFAAALWGEVAEKADCAIWLLHHFRKGGQSGEAQAFRGASALIDASRAALGLANMSAEEADRLGVADADRRFLIRADNAKLNLAPPPEHTVWLKLCSVELPNGEPLKGQDGDNVQAVERWQPASPWEGLSMSMVVRILDRFVTGTPEGEQFTLNRTGKTNARWAGQVVVEIGAMTEGQAAQIIRRWTDEELLKPTQYRSAKTSKNTSGLTVDQDKLSKMRQQISDPNHGGDE